MATFTGTAGVDTFIGADNVADIFRFDPTDLAATDTVTGGTGGVVDELRFIAAGTLAASVFANVTGIETISLGTGANSLTIPDALAASADGASLTVLGGDGDDTIDASLLTAANRVFVYTGSGTAAISGGAGDDWYVINNAADTIVEAAGQGAADRVFAHVSYTLGAGVAIEMFSTDDHAGTAAIDLTGNELPNAIYGNAGNNTLNGGGGNDSLDGFGGIDTLNGGPGDDWFYASAGASTLNGNDGSDLLFGIAGSPAVMTGGADDDWYFVANAGDAVNEAAGQGATDRVFTHVSYTLGAGVAIEIFSTDDHAGTAAIDLTGNELANAIWGNAGNNILDGGAGADFLAGLAGNDWYFVDNANDFVREAPGEGTLDRVFARASFALPSYAEIEILSTDDHAGTAAINLTGGELADAIYGNAGNNTLNGGGGNDSLDGFGGIDTLNGGPGDDQLYASAGASTLNGDDGSDLLFGIAGSPAVMTGGADDDWYFVANAADVVNEAANEGTLDRVFAHVSYTLGAGVEIENFSTDDHGGTTAINLTGNELANVIYGNAGDNTLTGGAGDDWIDGLGGIDTLSGGQGADQLHADAGASTLNGDEGNDVLYGGGIDTLNGGQGNDRLYPGAGASTLNGDEGDDQLYAGAGASTLNGDDGNDRLYGLPGSPAIMNGGAGDDWYFVANAGDVVNEAADEGTLDRISAHVSYTLAAGSYVEQLSTDDDAGTAAIDLAGNELDNAIYGNAGNNTLQGGAGDDRLDGLAGNDTLEGGDGADRLIGGSGSDTASYAHATAGVTANLAAPGANLGDALADTYESIENLIGCAFADSLRGNGSNNILSGLGGDDRYYVDGAGDVVHEAIGEGNDRVFTPVSYVLQAGQEVEILSTNDDDGTAAINLTGNELANIIIGNAASNILVGGAGDDTLNGQGGVDTADYSNATGSVTVNSGLSGPQAIGGGTGTDNLILMENLTSSAFADSLTGSDSDNILEGRAGADHLIGGLGLDTASYAHASADVTINLGAPGANLGEAAGDTYDSIERIVGSAFGDTLRGDGNDNSLMGGAGNDTLDGSLGYDTADYSGATGKISVFLDRTTPQAIGGGAGTDTLISIEKIIGGTFHNIVWSEEPGTTFVGGGGGNVFHAMSEAGGYTFIGGGAADAVWISTPSALTGSTLVGGAGTDWLMLEGPGVLDAGKLAGVRGFESIQSIGGISSGILDITLDDAFVSSASNHRLQIAVDFELKVDASALTGDNAIDVQVSYSLHAILIGGAGADVLRGSFRFDAGDDNLTGGGGADTLSGFGGSDVFAYRAATDGGDTIMDFEPADTLQFDAAAFGFTPGHALADGADFISAASPAPVLAQATFLMDTTTHQVLWDADGTGSAAAVLIATLSNNANAAASDFLLV